MIRKEISVGFLVLLFVLTACTQSTPVSSQTRHPDNENESGVQTALSLDTLEYKYYDPNIPFTFRYPKNYCTTQDIAAVVVHKPPFCGGNNAINVEGNSLTVLAFPEVGVNSTEEYINIILDNLKKTNKKKIIGGYEAINLVDEQRPNVIIYAFLTNIEFIFPTDSAFGEMSGQNTHNKYGIIIESTLSNYPDGKETEELILSTFSFN